MLSIFAVWALAFSESCLAANFYWNTSADQSAASPLDWNDPSSWKTPDDAEYTPVSETVPGTSDPKYFRLGRRPLFISSSTDITTPGFYPWLYYADFAEAISFLLDPAATLFSTGMVELRRDYAVSNPDLSMMRKEFNFLSGTLDMSNGSGGKNEIRTDSYATLRFSGPNTRIKNASIAIMDHDNAIVFDNGVKCENVSVAFNPYGDHVNSSNSLVITGSDTDMGAFTLEGNNAWASSVTISNGAHFDSFLFKRGFDGSNYPNLPADADPTTRFSTSNVQLDMSWWQAFAPRGYKFDFGPGSHIGFVGGDTKGVGNSDVSILFHGAGTIGTNINFALCAPNSEFRVYDGATVKGSHGRIGYERPDAENVVGRISGAGSLWLVEPVNSDLEPVVTIGHGNGGNNYFKGALLVVEDGATMCVSTNRNIRNGQVCSRPTGILIGKETGDDFNTMIVRDGAVVTNDCWTGVGGTFVASGGVGGHDNLLRISNAEYHGGVGNDGIYTTTLFLGGQNGYSNRFEVVNGGLATFKGGVMMSRFTTGGGSSILVDDSELRIQGKIDMPNQTSRYGRSRISVVGRHGRLSASAITVDSGYANIDTSSVGFDLFLEVSDGRTAADGPMILLTDELQDNSKDVINALGQDIDALAVSLDISRKFARSGRRNKIELIKVTCEPSHWDRYFGNVAGLNALCASLIDSTDLKGCTLTCEADQENRSVSLCLAAGPKTGTIIMIGETHGKNCNCDDCVQKRQQQEEEEMKKASEAALAALLAASLATSEAVPVAFELPAGGHYQVTLAATKPDDPDKVLATFVCGQTFDTTETNQFVVEWDGLDDNFMPLPPGEYAIKGIYSPAHRWAVDGEYHAISARWVGGAGEWWPAVDTENIHEIPIPFFGDPVNSPLLDIDVTPEGIAVLGYQYLENGRSCPLFDLAQPKGYAQFIAAFPSGGAGGGPCACTDGETVWACSFDSAPYFVYRPDMKPFGDSNAMFRKGGYMPEGIVTDMAAAKFGSSSFVYVVERGTIEAYANQWGGTSWRESETLHTDVITVMAGENGTILAKVPVPSSPSAAKVVGDDLFVLYKPDGSRSAIGRMPIADGIPGTVQKVFDVPAGWTVEDFARDAAGNFFFADGTQNKICKTDSTGKILATAGRLAKQISGSYDELSLMNPRRLDCWTDANGVTRVVVVEQDGPNRISEWNGADLSYLGEYENYQLKANSGYDADPANPSKIYIPGQNNWLVRFNFDYATGEWTTEAVFEGVPDDVDSGLVKVRVFRVGGRLYLVSPRSGAIFRLSDDGNSIVRAGSARDTPGLPASAITYHGQNFLSDLTYIGIAQGTDSVWVCRPTIDANGDVTYAQAEKIITDPYFTNLANGTATAFTGGNELATRFSSDWMQADGDIGGDIYVQARGGENYSANFGAQHKITRYVPDGDGGYKLKWRVGRTALAGSAKERGLIYGGMRIFKPINGILSVIDQSRSGVHLYTDDGLFIDTLFTGDAYTGATGVYEQPGEFFVGTIYANTENGKIYYASGKYSPMLFEMEGWDVENNPVKPLEVAAECRTVTLSAAKTATPPAEALRLRKATGAPGVATFRPEAVGWEGADPITFSDSGDTVQVRCLYSSTPLTLK